MAPSQYSWTRGLEKYAYTPAKTINSLSYPSSLFRKHLYLTLKTWSSWAPGRWVLFIHCNPTSEVYGRNDRATDAAIKVAQSLGFGGMGNLYLFSAKKAHGDLDFSKQDIGKGSAYWAKFAFKKFKMRIAAWGDSGTAMDRDFDVWYPGRPMLCLGRTESGNPIPVTDYAGSLERIKLLPFYINPLKRDIACDLTKGGNMKMAKCG